MDLKEVAQDLKRTPLLAFDPVPDLQIRRIENRIIYPFEEALAFLFSHTLSQFGFRERQAALLTEQIINRFKHRLGSRITRKIILAKKAAILKEQAVIIEGGNKIYFGAVSGGFDHSPDTIFVGIAIGRILVGLAESWDELGGDQQNRKAKR